MAGLKQRGAPERSPRPQLRPPDLRGGGAGRGDGAGRTQGAGNQSAGNQSAGNQSAGNQAAQDRVRQRTQDAPSGTTESGTTESGTTESGTTESATSVEPIVDDLMIEAVVTAVLAVVPQSMRDPAESGVAEILSRAANDGVQNYNQVAYLLASAQHESRFGKTNYRRSEPLVEDRNSISRNGDSYTAAVHTNDKTVTGSTQADAEQNYWDSAYGHKLGNQPGTTDGMNYRGRGFVQLTGRENYGDLSERLNAEGFTYFEDGVTWGRTETPIDLVTHYDHVNRNERLAAEVLTLGTMEGEFTGKGLPDYVNDEETDFVNARRTINGDVEENGATIAAIAAGYAMVLTTIWPLVFWTPDMGPR